MTSSYCDRFRTGKFCQSWVEEKFVAKWDITSVRQRMNTNVNADKHCSSDDKLHVITRDTSEITALCKEFNIEVTPEVKYASNVVL